MTMSRRDFVRHSTVALATAGIASSAQRASAETPTTADFTSFLDASGDELKLAGRALSWWTDTFGLPLHVSYAPDIRANVRAFQQVFKTHYPKAEVRYAGKADTHPHIFKIVGDEGAGIDVASPYEARAALDANIPGDRLDLNGNAKDDELINLAIAKDMLIVIDSIEELERVATLAAAEQKKPRAILRVSGYDLGPVTASAIFTAGTWTKFGISIAHIPGLIPKLKEMPVNVLGFHTHIGSQITDLNAYRAVLGKLLELGGLLAAAGHKFDMVNIGGGYPVSYVTEEEWNTTTNRIRDGWIAAKNGDASKIYLWENGLGAFRIGDDGLPGMDWLGEFFWARYPKEKMLEALLLSEIEVNGKTFKTLDALMAAGSPTLVIEPGRAIVSDAALTFAKVAFSKTIAEHHPMIAMDMGVVYYAEAMVALPVRNWSIATEPNRRDPQPFEAFIAGNLCFNADMLSRLKVPLQRKPVRGDVLLIPNTGAYCPTFFAANANSFPRPSRIIVEADGTWSHIKTRDTYEEIFSLDQS